MTVKFIHDNFELDLSHKEFAFNEENNWFTESSFYKYTYPVDLEVTDVQHKALGYILDEYIQNRITVYEGRFYALNEAHKAILEIQKVKGRVVTLQINYGFEELPNAQKMLSELPLEYIKLESEENLFDIAAEEINQAWPDANYCWHRVNTDRIDKENPQWEFFEGAINNFDKTSGEMLLNEYDAIEDLQINRNILQPIPYLLHILQKGFEDAGYDLQGDVLTMDVLKKTTVFHFSKYYSSFNENKQELYVKGDEWTTLFHPNCALYDHIIYLPEPGRYTIAGNFMLRASADTNQSGEIGIGTSWAEITYVPGVGIPAQQLWFHQKYNAFSYYKEWFKSMEATFDYYGTGGYLIITVQALPWAMVDEVIVEDPMTIDITLSQRAKYDSNGDAVATLIVPNEIHLQKCVPQMSFGDFVRMVQKLRNLDITVDETNKVIKMNRVFSHIQNQPVLSLVGKEAAQPEIEYTQGKSYILKFQEVDHEEYTWQQVRADISGEEYGSKFPSVPDTEEIVIDALPMPHVTKNGALTAFDFSEDDAKCFLCLYEGLDSDGNNFTEDPEPLLIPAIYTEEYATWIAFLLKGKGYTWSFDSFFEETLNLKVKSIIHCYQQRHIIKRLTRSNISPEVIYTEIESKTLL